jgi:hypothetical protein
MMVWCHNVAALELSKAPLSRVVFHNCVRVIAMSLDLSSELVKQDSKVKVMRERAGILYTEANGCDDAAFPVINMPPTFIHTMTH